MFHSVCPRIAPVMAILCLSLVNTSKAELIAGEGFDGNDLNLISTQNVFSYGGGGGGGGAVFGIVSKSFAGGTGMPAAVADDSVQNVSGNGVNTNDNLGIAGAFSDGFFAMNNMVSLGLNNAVWTFDISSAVELDYIIIGAGAMGSFEGSDGFQIEMQLDGGGYVEIYRAVPDEDASLTYQPFDDGDVATYDDPLELYVDGKPYEYGPIYLDYGLGAGPASWLVDGLSGSELDIRLTWLGNPASDESMGIDSISIVGVIPEPAALTLLGLGGLAILRRRR